MGNGMNSTIENKRLIRALYDMASPNWEKVPSAQHPAQLALKMHAALEMTLQFHASSPWDEEMKMKWQLLQQYAGRETQAPECTTKSLCDTIREVLGIQEERR